MATYWVTFRIKNETVSGRTYDDRYNGFREAIRQRTKQWWLPPTSFIVFESDADMDTICGDLKKTVSAANDVFLIGMPEFKSARIYGKNDDKDVYKLIPFLKDA